MEESRALLDSAERANRQLVGDIADARNSVSEMQSINSRDQTTKRSLEGSIHTIQADIDAMLQAAKIAEEKSKKAMMDAAALRMSFVLNRTILTPKSLQRNLLN